MQSYAKKRFGQNFLIDPNIVRKIIKEINPLRGEILVEIGPGKGALTRQLVATGAQIHAIEIDKNLTSELAKEFAGLDNFTLYQQDALKFDYQAHFSQDQKIRIVGNIPYNISSPLLFKVFENNNIIRDVHFLVQREIAQRICAKPNTKSYGILSVITQFYGKPSIAFQVSPKVFRPIPEVYSALVKLIIEPHSQDTNFQADFHTVVKTAFGKRRKILRNSLAEIIQDRFDECPIDLSRRAESLTLAEFMTLTHWIFSGK
jgi:16S rRNA (adenine1518-N6/adenine1519-N6)-dimethyltransferase